MPHRLNALYHSFFVPEDLDRLRSSVDENHKILISRLSKEDKKSVLRIIDALNMICNHQTKSSFIQGLKFGIEFANELQN